MTADPIARLLRQIDKLDDKDVLRLHREVCRRAAYIYEPIHRAKREANWPTGMAAARPKIAAHNARVKEIAQHRRDRLARGGEGSR